METSLELHQLVGHFGQRHGLSTREAEIVALLIVEGGSPTAIASRLKRSRHTVHNHLKSIFRRTGSTGCASLMARFILESFGQDTAAAVQFADEAHGFSWPA